jgi:O-antigen/teichoic acid export membrane protein
LRSNLGGLHLFKTDSIISVFDRALMIIVCSILLWGNVVNEFKIQYFVYAQTFSYSITALVTMVLVFRKADVKFMKLSWNLPFFLMILRQSFPFAILVLLMAFYNRIDSVMLERMLDDGARFSGIYASAYRLLDAANMFAYLFAVLLLPIFARMLKQNESIEQLIKLSFTLLITPAIIVAVGSYFYAEELMRLLYSIHEGESVAEFNERIIQSSMVFGVLMACFCAISSMYVFSTLLTANGNLKILNIIALSGMIVNIVLNIILIPRYQAFGSAIATLITQFLTATIQVIVVCRIFKFRKNYTYIFKLAFYLIGVYLISYFSRQLSLDWYVGFGIMILLSVSLALVIRLLSPRQLFQIIRYGEKA